MYIEVLPQMPVAGSGEATHGHIVFVHGGNHAAWAWEDHFLPWFEQREFRVHALSLRGHGASAGTQRLRWHSLRDYVDDVAHVVRERAQGQPFVLVGHSIGGGVVQRYLSGATQQRDGLPRPAGAVLMNTTTARGWKKLVLMPGGILRHPGDVWRIFVHGDLRYLTATPQRVREYFFTAQTPEETVVACYERLRGESFRALWDLLNFPTTRTALPIQVLGSTADGCMPPELVKALADAYEVSPLMFAGGHDSMLDTHWEDVATAIADFAGRCGISSKDAFPQQERL